MATLGGWAGKVLRVDLSTGKITSEDSAKYKDYLGGVGLAYKVMWDEVPAGTDAHAPENKIVFGAGVFSGSGIPQTSRSIVTSVLANSPFKGVGSGHMGGQWAAELKFAGWDSVIVQGKSEKPVWICIQDGDVSIRDAKKLWGTGVFQTQALICEEMGADAQVLCIGQSGEHLVRSSCILNQTDHSGEGGSPMGAKNLKAVAVKGTGAVKVAAKKEDWLALLEYHLQMMGDQKGFITPKWPQPWAEYYGGTGGRWAVGKGRYWGAADPPVELTDGDPKDWHTFAYRVGYPAYGTLGDRDLERFVVRGHGCFSCPLACHGCADNPNVGQWGARSYVSDECGGWGGAIDVWGDVEREKQLAYDGDCWATQLGDDYGQAGNHGIVSEDFLYTLEKGIMKAKLPEKEWNSIPWALREKGDPRFLADIYRRIAFREGELGDAFAEGSYNLHKRWGLPPLPQIHQEGHDPSCGHTPADENTYRQFHHHQGRQVMIIINLMYNRELQDHMENQLMQIPQSIPTPLFKEILAEIIGSGDAADHPDDIKPMNKWKAKYGARFAALGPLADSVGVCGRGGGVWWFSPLKERKYRGDPELMAKEYTALTGEKKSMDDMLQMGWRINNLLRALNIRAMGTKDMRNKHDILPESLWNHPDWGDKKAFTPGTQRMDKADMELARDMMYEELGWDKATGAPTRETYEKSGLKDVADQLAKQNLL